MDNRDDRGLQLNAISWLFDHHKTKERERLAMVEQMGLQPGDVVLDLGCGPGFWTPMLAERVKPNGRVVGVDISPEVIDYASRSLEGSPLSELVEFHRADFHDVPFDSASFDFVFFGNCFMYVTDVPRVMAELRRVTRIGGRVAAKDFDGSVFVVHPVDPGLCSRVLSATAQGLEQNPPDPPFDNYSGRKLPAWFAREGYRDVTTRSYAIQKVPPLAPEAERYIRANAEWYLEMGEPFLSAEDVARWRDHFDPDGEQYVLTSPELYFCMLEVMSIGTV